MTRLAVAYNPGVSVTLKDSSRGASKEQDHIRKLLYEAQNYRTPENTGLRRLDDLTEECSKANWDGYGAIPLNANASRIARAILQTISGSFPAPDIVPEPDGEIAFEWENNDGSIFSLSMGGNGMLAFAGVYADGTKIHGSEPWHESTLSHAIIEYIGKAAFSE
jgi:hypothetical protein